MTIAFQFAFEMHLQENVAVMARQYVRSIISSVQRVALALSPSSLGPTAGLLPPPGTPEAQTLARWICQSYRWDAQSYITRGPFSRLNVSNNLVIFFPMQVLFRCGIAQTWKWWKWIYSQNSLASLRCHHVLHFEGTFFHLYIHICMYVCHFCDVLRVVKY